MKKIKKFVHMLLWKIYKLIPSSLKYKLIRSQLYIELPEGIYSEIEYKIAETHDEMDQAFRLIQDSYLASNLTSDETNLYRLNKFNLLPTTTVFIAKYKGKVIATVSQIMDTSLGLPIDSFTDVSFLRKKGERVSEISGLAIAKEWRSRSNGVFFPLTSYAVMYCKTILGVDYAVMVTRASVRHFYTAIYGFKSIDSKSKKYNVVNGKNSFAQFLNLNTLGEDLKNIYKTRPLRRNVYQLFQHFPWRHLCDFGHRKFSIISRQHFSITELEFLFTVNDDLKNNITSEDKRNLASIYFYKNMAQVFSADEYHYVTKRRFPRFQVNMGLTTSPKETFKVIEVSKGGFCIIGENVQNKIDGVIKINSSDQVGFKAVKCWEHQGRAGFKFLDESIPLEWQKMIDYSEKLFKNGDEQSRRLSA